MFNEEGSLRASEEEVYAKNREIRRDGNEVVRLGQTFPLFHPDRTMERYDPNGDFPDAPRYRSNVLLETDGRFPVLPMEISTFGCWHSKAQVFTPFDPAVGYSVGHDDFEGQTRLAKLRQPEYQKIEGIQGAPLTLSVCIGEWMNEDRAGGERPLIDPDSFSSGRDLRLQLSFPSGMRLEGRPEARGLDEGDIRFSHGFYPMDTGQLAVPDGFERYVFDGLDIALPANRHDLAQIQGRFVLSTDENGSD